MARVKRRRSTEDAASLPFSSPGSESGNGNGSSSPFGSPSKQVAKKSKQPRIQAQRTAPKSLHGKPRTAASGSGKRPLQEPSDSLAYNRDVVNQKCRIIDFIHTNYTQKGVEPPLPMELAREMHGKLAGLQIKDKVSQRIKQRTIAQVRNLMHGMLSRDYESGTTVSDFLRNPISRIAKSRPLWEEYRIFAGQVSDNADRREVAIEGDQELSDDSSTTLEQQQSSEGLETMASSKTPLLLVNRDSADHKRSDGGSVAVGERHERESGAEYPFQRHQSHARTIGLTEVIADSQPSSWSFESTSNHNSSVYHQSQNEPGLGRARQPQIPDVETPQRDGQRTGDGVASSPSEPAAELLVQQGRIMIEEPARPSLRIRTPDDFLPDGTRYTLNTGPLSGDLLKMFSQAKSRIHQALAAREVLKQPAKFLLVPPLGVQQLYLMITGVDKTKVVKSAIVAVASAETLALSLFSAFLVRVVWEKPGVETFNDFKAKEWEAATEIDEVLQEHRTDRDTVLRKAYLRRLVKGDWTQLMLRPIADQLSEDFAVRLEQHLGVTHGIDGQTYGPSMYALAGRFSGIILDALVFKCEISTARETTAFLWYTGGDEIDSMSMETNQEEHERVLLTEFPGFAIDEGGLDADLEVISRAQIVSRRN